LSPLPAATCRSTQLCATLSRPPTNHLAKIAAAAINAPAGTVPVIDYTEDEHRIWRLCQEQLAPKHEKYAHSEFLAAKHRLRLPTDHVPQLDQVSARLRPLTGWGYRAAPGLVPLREFYADLGARTFNSTQYLRHGPSRSTHPSRTSSTRSSATGTSSRHRASRG
jgi:phenylalanine-4-hydroxylase